MSDVRCHVFRGRKYNIRRVSASKLKSMKPKAKDTIGLCDPPDQKDKTIFFDKQLEGIKELDTELHEALHACYWDLDEEAVESGGKDIALFLWKLGYRKVE